MITRKVVSGACTCAVACLATEATLRIRTLRHMESNKHRGTTWSSAAGPGDRILTNTRLEHSLSRNQTIGKKQLRQYGIHDLRSGDRIQVKQAMPLQWYNVGCTAPPEGTELHNPYLVRALQYKTSLTQDEWDRCDIDNIRLDHFVYDGSKYLQPVAQCTWMGPTTPSVACVAKQQQLVHEALTTLRNGIILHFAQTQSAPMFADSWYALQAVQLPPVDSTDKPHRPLRSDTHGTLRAATNGKGSVKGISLEGDAGEACREDFVQSAADGKGSMPGSSLEGDVGEQGGDGFGITVAEGKGSLPGFPLECDAGEPGGDNSGITVADGKGSVPGL